MSLRGALLSEAMMLHINQGGESRSLGVVVQSHLVAQWGTVDGHVHNRQRYVGRQYRRCCRTDAAHSKYEVHKHLLYLNDLGQKRVIKRPKVFLIQLLIT